MHALIKTALIAAVGTSIAAVSPALARSHRAVPVYGMAVEPGVLQIGPHSPLYAAPGYWGDAQIRTQTIKDDTIHNGNAY